MPFDGADSSFQAEALRRRLTGDLPIPQNTRQRGVRPRRHHNVPIAFSEQIDARESVVPPLKEPSAIIPFRRDTDFVDRPEVFDRVQQECPKPGARTALVGLGGVGKSQLAIEFSYRIRDRSDTWVFWVHASNAARFEQSYRDIANYIKIPGWQDPKTDLYQLLTLVYDWLRDTSNGKWVLILDNVDDARFLLTNASTSSSETTRPLISYVPQCENGSVLITSRSKEIALKLVEQNEIIEVLPMNVDDAKTLLQKKLGDGEGVAELAEALEFMPLAMVQAASYISQRKPRYSVQKYLSDLRKSSKRENLLAHEGGQLRRDWEAKNSIIVTWQISFEHIRLMRPSAAKLLALISFFDCQGIPDYLLQTRIEPVDIQGKDEDDHESTSQSSQDDVFDDDVHVLRDFSFMSLRPDGTTFEMHRLVQLATQRWLKMQGDNQLEIARQNFLYNLQAEFPTGEYINWPKCQILFPHAKLAAAHKPEHESDQTVWAALLYNAGWYALRIGTGAEAERLALLVLSVREKVLGPEHVDTLNGMALLALTHQLNGKWEAAGELSSKVLEISKTQLGGDHQTTIRAMANLAATYRYQANFEASERLDRAVVDAYRRTRGMEDHDYFVSVGNLTVTLLGQGKWQAAEEMLVEVIKSCQKHLGEHPDTFAMEGNLGFVYIVLGKWKAAETLLKAVLVRGKKHLGDAHPITLSLEGDLAMAYNNQGNWKMAEELGVKTIDIRKQVSGLDHPATLLLMSNLASTYISQARWNEAENLLKEVHGLSEAKMGANHPRMLIVKANLASVYRSQGKFGPAESLQAEVVAISKVSRGEDHPDTWTSMYNLASIYHEQERYDEAEALNAKLLESFRAKLGTRHPSTLLCMHGLARTYLCKKQLDAAEKLQVEVLELRKEVSGVEHHDTLAALGNLALTYLEQNKLEAAEELETQAIEIYQRKVGETHPQTLISMGNLAQIYSEQGKLEASERLESATLAARRIVLGNEHPDTITSLGNLASLYTKQGNDAAAETLTVEALELSKKARGERYFDTMAYMHNLANIYRAQNKLTEAEKLILKALELRKIVLGPDHKHTLHSMEVLCETYHSQKRWKEEEELLGELIERRDRAYGKESSWALRTRADLTRNYRGQKKYDEAEKLEVEIFDGSKKVYGEEHGETLASMHNLSLSRYCLGRTEEGMKMLKESLQIRERTTGAGDSDYIKSSGVLAIWEKKQEAAAVSLEENHA